MRELLPAGNVAHGLVFNYYIGFLAHVLPGKFIACLQNYLKLKRYFYFIEFPSFNELKKRYHLCLQKVKDD